MAVAFGIDVGGSTTKFVAVEPAGMGDDVHGKAMAVPHVLATRRIDNAQVEDAGVEDAFRDFLRDEGLAPHPSDALALTGAGSPSLPDELLGMHVRRVSEFEAIGRGGAALLGATPEAAGVTGAAGGAGAGDGPEAAGGAKTGEAPGAGGNLEAAECPSTGDVLVVSLGSGTALVRVRGHQTTHLGGSGVGGMFLTGMGELLLGTSDASETARLAARGDRGGVDLQVRDLCPGGIPGLPPDLTAANFGKARIGARREDVAAALANTVAETVGMMAVFACKGGDVRDVALVGTLAETLPQVAQVAAMLGRLHGLRIVVPRHASFATAVGAALRATDGAA